MGFLKGYFLVGAFVAILSASGAHAEDQRPMVKILSPPDNTVVRPGQTVKVVVSATGHFRALAVLGDDPIGIHPLILGRRSFTFRIPKDAPLGTFGVSASGATVDGKQITDDINLDVERDDAPVSVTTNLGQKLWLNEGHKPFFVDYMATYPDGKQVRLNDSKQKMLVSKDPTIVSVNQYGLLVPLKPGTTELIVAGKCCVTVEVLRREPRATKSRP